MSRALALIAGLSLAASLGGNAHALRLKDVKHYPGFSVPFDGYKIWVETHGDPTQSAVLFFPGGPGQGHVYLHVPDSSWNALGKDHFVIYFDPPGTGKSGKPPSGEYGYELNSRAAKAVWEAVQKRFAGKGLDPTQKLNLIGHSAGGGMVLDFATRHPELVRAIILAAGNDTHAGEVQGAQSFENKIIRSMFPREWAKLMALRRANPQRDRAGRPIESDKVKRLYTRLSGKSYLDALYPQNEGKLVYQTNPDIWYAFYGENADFEIRTRWDVRSKLRKLAEHGIRIRYLIGTGDHNEPPEVLIKGVKTIGYGSIKTYDAGHPLMLKGEAGQASLKDILSHFRPSSRTGAPGKARKGKI